MQWAEVQSWLQRYTHLILTSPLLFYILEWYKRKSWIKNTIRGKMNPQNKQTLNLCFQTKKKRCGLRCTRYLWIFKPKITWKQWASTFDKSNHRKLTLLTTTMNSIQKHRRWIKHFLTLSNSGLRDMPSEKRGAQSKG